METVQLYFNNIWSWFVENKDSITAFFMSGQFVSFCGACVMLVKNIKQVKNNTDSTNSLKETLNKTNDMSNKITSVENDVRTLTKENTSLRGELHDTEDKLTYDNQQLIDKMNAILEVQSIVYSTIRDDEVRRTVNTILNNARYSDVNTRDQLQAQIDQLKNTFDDKITAVTESVNKAINDVSSGINAVETAKKKAQMLKGIHENTTRY